MRRKEKKIDSEINCVEVSSNRCEVLYLNLMLNIQKI
jgi:hypothetical protein